jgi:hypothetical protein
MAGLVATALLVIPAPKAEAQQATPAVRVSVRSLESLESWIDKVVTPFSEDASKALFSAIYNGLGITDPSLIDRTKPWDVALWFERFGASPSISLRLPVKSMEDFRESLTDESLLLPTNEESSIREIDGYGVFLASFTPLTDSMQAAEKAWKPASVMDVFTSPDETVIIGLQMTETLRSSLQQLLGFSRKMMMQTFEAMGGEKNNREAQAPTPVPFNPVDMAGIMGIYFDILHNVVGDLEAMQLGLGSDGQDLVNRFHWSPLEGSDTAQCFAAPEGSVDQLLQYLPPGRSGYFAARVSFPAEFLPTVARFMDISMKAQGLEMSEEDMKHLMDMIAGFLDYNAAGFIDMQKGMKFGMAYDFERPAEETMKAFMDYYQSPGFSAIAGDDKFFKSVSIKEKSVSRSGDRPALEAQSISMKINMDSPLFQLPVQREMMTAMYGGDEIYYEIAVDDGHLLYTMNTGLEELHKGTGPDASLPIESNTILSFRADGLKLLRGALQSHESLNEKLESLNISSAGISMHTVADGELKSTLRLSENWLRILSAFLPASP